MSLDGELVGRNDSSEEQGAGMMGLQTCFRCGFAAATQDALFSPLS